MAFKSFSSKSVRPIKENDTKKGANIEDQKTPPEISRKVKTGRKKNTKQHIVVDSPALSKINMCRTHTRRNVSILSLSYAPVPMAPYYPFSANTFSYPVTNTWNHLIPVQRPLYSVPVAPLPVTLIRPQLLTAQVCPYSRIVNGPSVLPDPFMPVVPSVVAPYETPLCNVSYETVSSYSDQMVPSPSHDFDSFTELSFHETAVDKPCQKVAYPLEYYLSLPRELFPNAKMLTIDPNPIIDELCKLVNISCNSPWILDLEFGVPRHPVTRPIANYNAEFNSIHCKNTPGAIHPVFESCNQDFKRILLFYYDCVISTWYRGYMVTTYDRSVVNFQSWMQLPMQVLGLCWR